MALLDEAKTVCRVTSTAFDDEIQLLIDAGKDDLNIAGVDGSMATRPLVKRALLTYISMNFKLNNGQIDTLTYDRLKDSYDEQKAQMTMSDEYRVDDDGRFDDDI